MRLFISSFQSAMGRGAKTTIWFLLVFLFTVVSIIGFYFTDMNKRYETSIKSIYYNAAVWEEREEDIEITENIAVAYSGIAGMLIKISNVIFSGIYVTMSVVLLCITVIWVRDHHSDIGIYIILGRSKFKIILQLLLEMSIVTLAAMLPATFAGIFLVNQYGAGILTGLREHMGYQFYSSIQEMDKMILHSKLPFSAVMISNLMVFTLLLFFVSVLGVVAVFRRPGYLFEQDK